LDRIVEIMVKAEVAITLAADGYEYFSVADVEAALGTSWISDVRMGGRAVGGGELIVELHRDSSSVSWSDENDLLLNGAGIAIVSELRRGRRVPSEILGLLGVAALFLVVAPAN